jgi:hypothetical protein
MDAIPGAVDYNTFLTGTGQGQCELTMTIPCGPNVLYLQTYPIATRGTTWCLVMALSQFKGMLLNTYILEALVLPSVSPITR